MRRPLIAGNWKLNKTANEARDFVRALQNLVPPNAHADIAVFPVFTALAAAVEAAGGQIVGIGAQDVYWKDNGAYTGEVSAPLLRDAGCTYVLVGHSERRGRFGVPEPDLAGDAGRVFGDTDESVNKKTLAAIAHGLIPIICVGETLDERRAGQTDEIVQAQTRAAIAGVLAQTIGDLVFAYEPVWAIGTGETCDAGEADRVCGVIRATAGSGAGGYSEGLRVLYGGSVKPDNARDLLSRPHIDGALVGGASLQAESFAQIIAATNDF